MQDCGQGSTRQDLDGVSLSPVLAGGGVPLVPRHELIGWRILLVRLHDGS